LNRHFQNQSDEVHILRQILQTASLDLQFNIETENHPAVKWTIHFTGPDTPMLTANDGKLLDALGHLIAENFDFAEVRAEVASIILDGTRAPFAEARTN
jgi:predicted RNA-binding protein Jag